MSAERQAAGGVHGADAADIGRAVIVRLRLPLREIESGPPDPSDLLGHLQWLRDYVALRDAADIHETAGVLTVVSGREVEMLDSYVAAGWLKLDPTKATMFERRDGRLQASWTGAYLTDYGKAVLGAAPAPSAEPTSDDVLGELIREILTETTQCRPVPWQALAQSYRIVQAHLTASTTPGETVGHLGAMLGEIARRATPADPMLAIALYRRAKGLMNFLTRHRDDALAGQLQHGRLLADAALKAAAEIALAPFSPSALRPLGGVGSIGGLPSADLTGGVDGDDFDDAQFQAAVARHQTANFQTPGFDNRSLTMTTYPPTTPPLVVMPPLVPLALALAQGDEVTTTPPEPADRGAGIAWLAVFVTARRAVDRQLVDKIVLMTEGEVVKLSPYFALEWLKLDMRTRPFVSLGGRQLLGYAFAELTMSGLIALGYHDPGMSDQVCGYCHGIYRGPAVYCSLVCAQADA